MRSVFRLLAAVILSFYSFLSHAGGHEELDRRLQAIKADFLQLSRQAEASSALSTDQVLLGFTEKSTLSLDKVALKMNGQQIFFHDYVASENQALREGGLQAIANLRLPQGRHQMVLTYSGLTPNGEKFSQASKFSLSKSSSPKVVELILKNKGNSVPGLSKREH